MKPRNFVAKDLRTPKYRMRVEGNRKYHRATEKRKTREDLANT